jgi:hypothetical protein
MKTCQSSGMLIPSSLPGKRMVLHNVRDKFLLAFVLCLFALALWPQHSWPEISFKKEFDEICARTSDAASLSVDELGALIDRCEKLRPVIERAAVPERTVYLKRLRMCQALFAYVLESKKMESKEEVMSP